VTRLLAGLLVVYEPLNLALTAAALLPGLTDRGWSATALLVARLAITGFGFAVGRSLWARDPGALSLARWATGLNLATALLIATTRIWPSSFPPGVRGPAATVTIVWYAGWFMWTLRQAGSSQHDVR
jgi:hypothetical protein